MYIVLLKSKGELVLKLTKLTSKVYISQNLFFNYLCKSNKNFLFVINVIASQIIVNKELIYFSYLNYFFFRAMEKLKFFFNESSFFNFRLFKFHGINMRVVYLKKLIACQFIFLRLAYSHGILLCLPRTVLLKIFKKRYILLATFDLNYLNNLTYTLKTLKKFFNYKLIGIKLVRDNIKIKIGKKKTI